MHIAFTFKALDLLSTGGEKGSVIWQRSNRSLGFFCDSVLGLESDLSKNLLHAGVKIPIYFLIHKCSTYELKFQSKDHKKLADMGFFLYVSSGHEGES